MAPTDAPIAWEAGVVYSARVILANAASDPKTVHLITQVPTGAVPLRDPRSTAVRSVQIPANGTKETLYRYYFPKAGTATYFPAQVSAEGRWVAGGRPVNGTVSEASGVEKSVHRTPHRLHYEAVQADDDQLLQYLRTADITDFPFQAILHRQMDREFSAAVSEILKERYVVDEFVWKFAFLFRRADDVREVLASRPQFLESCGPIFTSPLVTCDPLANYLFECINVPWASDRDANNVRNVVDRERRSQEYAKLLNILVFRSTLTPHEKRLLMHHLLKQERLPEASALWARLQRSDYSEPAAYDYMEAWMAKLAGEKHIVERMADKHQDHPQRHWRRQFNQLRHD